MPIGVIGTALISAGIWIAGNIAWDVGSTVFENVLVALNEAAPVAVAAVNKATGVAERIGARKIAGALTSAQNGLQHVSNVANNAPSIFQGFLGDYIRKIQY